MLTFSSVLFSRKVALYMYVEYSNTLEGGIPFLLPLQKAKATNAATPTAAIITSTAILTPTDRGTGNQFIKHH